MSSSEWREPTYTLSGSACHAEHRLEGARVEGERPSGRLLQSGAETMVTGVRVVPGTAVTGSQKADLC